MSARHFYKTSLNFAGACATAAVLSACANRVELRLPWHEVPAPNTRVVAPTMVEPSDTTVAAVSVDPLTAQPPPAAAPVMAEAMLVPAPSSGPPGNGSQRVPLGALDTPTPANGAPISIMQQPQAKPQPTQQAAVMPAPAMTPAPAPMPAEPQASNPREFIPIAPAVPVAEPPPVRIVQEAPRPAPVAPAASFKPAVAPVLRAPLGRPTTTPLVEHQVESENAPETVIISSKTAPPVDHGREFVPAAVVPGQILIPGLVRSETPMNGAERNIAQRFETLHRLQEEGLITQD